MPAKVTVFTFSTEKLSEQRSRFTQLGSINKMHMFGVRFVKGD